jgi:putative transcriptional regulator
MKRNLFAELKEGFDALEANREGAYPAASCCRKAACTGDHRRRTVGVARAAFRARCTYLRTNERTLENWEQGRARPNAQAALLIRMVERYPDTVERLAGI